MPSTYDWLMCLPSALRSFELVCLSEPARSASQQGPFRRLVPLPMIDSVLTRVIFSPADFNLPPGVRPTSSIVLPLPALDSITCGQCRPDENRSLTIRKTQ